jgi:uncharacterized membrane protein YeiH
MILNYAGIAVFAASGAVVGVRKGFDLFGIAMLGVLTGVGGGVLRDVLLDITPPQSIENWPNITVALIAVAVATPFARIVIQMKRAVLVLDAIGMGFFAASGAAIAVDAGASWFAAGLIGMLTAIVGGMLRDVCMRSRQCWARRPTLPLTTSGRSGWASRSGARWRRCCGLRRWPSTGGYRRAPGS